MKKKIVALLLAGVLACSVIACGAGEEAKKEAEVKTEANTNEEEKAEVTYQSILDDYTKEIEEATPKLVEEYNSESASISTDLNALAELSNKKITALAEISNEGISKMAELMTKNGDEYSLYEEWAQKLTDVYTEYAGQITDAYTNSASGMSTEDMMNSLNALAEEQ